MTSLSIPSGAPRTEQELLARAHAIAGYSLGQLATIAEWQTPTSLRHAKGWAGQLIELFLGATAGSRPEQDFPELRIELKTIPVDEFGAPLETTYVCIAPLLNLNGVTWEQSNVRNKLQRVLWLPIDGRREIPPGERVIGHPILWTPNKTEESILRQDWEELTDMVVLGQVESITARVGTALQIRPKAADGKALTQAIGPNGGYIQTRPRGYYLKKQYTAAILHRALGEHDE